MNLSLDFVGFLKMPKVKNNSFTLNLDNFKEVHCVSCGRFLGYYESGCCLMYCKKCKSFTIVLPDFKLVALDKNKKDDKIKQKAG